MLPFSLAIIVLIFAVWQEVMLSPKKQELKMAFEYYDSIKQEVNQLTPPKKCSKKYYFSSPAPNIKQNDPPKFPR